MSIKKTRIWKFFSSIKLAVWLLAVIAVLSLIGTFIPQNQSPEFYIEKIGHAGYSVLLKTGLGNIYCSWYFMLFLVLLSLSLTVCLANRLPLKVRTLGTFISHLGILVILIGASIGIIYGEKALIKINNTEEISSFMTGGRSVDLGFSIRLDDFIYTEHIDPKERLSVYPVGDHGEEPIARLPVEIGKEFRIADTGSSVRILRYLPDFVMDISAKSASSRSGMPNNPAIEVELKDKNGNIGTFWVFARFPDMHQKAGRNFEFIYNWVGRRPKDFISKVTVLKGAQEIMRRDIRVNEPLSFGGYKFFQSTYDTEALKWSGLQVVKDPGVGVVYAGFLLLIAGVTAIFYVNPIIPKFYK